jgi:Spy/CpxP family protein refolding chaperone
MKARTTSLICAVLFSAAALTAPALRAEDAAAKPAAQDSKNADKKLAHLKKKLALSDEQAAKLKDVWTAQKAAMKPIRDKLKKGLDQLRAQVKAKASDAEITATLDQLNAAREEMRAQTEKTMSASETILTPTQRAKIALHMAKRRHRWFAWLRHKKDDDAQ